MDLPKDILFNSTGLKKPLYKSQKELALDIFNIKDSGFSSVGSLKTLLSKVLKGNRSISNKLKEAILKALKIKVKDDIVFETISNKLEIAFNHFDSEIKNDLKSSKSSPLKIGAGYAIYSSPIILMMEEDEERFNIALFGKKTKSKSIKPEFGSVPVDGKSDNIFNDTWKPFDANDLIPMLIRKEIDVACIADSALVESKSIISEQLLKVCTIIDSAASGIQLHVSTKNERVQKFLDHKNQGAFDFNSEDSIVNFFTEIQSKTSGKPFPFLRINNTISEFEAKKYIIDRLEGHEAAFPGFKFGDISKVGNWKSLFNSFQELIKLEKNIVNDTFFYMGWAPHLNWLSDSDDLNNYKKYTYSFSYVKSPENPKYFNFVIVIHKDKYNDKAFKKKLDQFVISLQKKNEEISNPEFRNQPMKAAPLLRRMGVVENQEQFFNSLFRIRFDVKFFTEYLYYKNIKNML